MIASSSSTGTGRDANDWLTDHSKIRVRPYVAARRPGVAPPSVTPTDRWSVASLMAEKIVPPKRWLGSLIFEGSRVMLSGGTGVGKSRFVLGGIIAAMLHGRGFAHWTPDPGIDPPRVLFVDYELGRLSLRDILQSLGDIPDGLNVVCYDDHRLGDEGLRPLDSDAGQEQMLALLKETAAQVVVLDNLYSACVGSILGGSEKNGAHDKLVPFLRQLSKDGIASLCCHHSGHDQTRAYGDSRLTWQMTAHLHLEASENRRDGELRVVVCERKMRGAPRREPFEMAFDGTWSEVVAAATAKPLSARQSWLCMTAETMLTKDGFRTDGKEFPVAFTSNLREAYRDKWFAHDRKSAGERKAWERDVEACVTYFTVGGNYFHKTQRDA